MKNLGSYIGDLRSGALARSLEPTGFDARILVIEWVEGGPRRSITAATLHIKRTRECRDERGSDAAEAKGTSKWKKKTRT